MQFITYLFFRFFVLIFAVIPFWLLYRISDLLSYLFFYILPYRKKVVLNNIRNSFPDKTESEVNKIAIKFYRNLSDILIEGLKGFSISKKSIIKRYNFTNIELLDKYKAEEQSVILTSSHYSNWEWGALVGGLRLPVNCVGFYKPLTNKFTDSYMRKKRSKWQMDMISIYKTQQAFIKNRDKCSGFIMVADQSPVKENKILWLDFLNQETAFLLGPEKYAKSLKLPVIFLDIQRVKRGHYSVDIQLLSKEPESEKEFEITKKFAKVLENQIKNKPENWLWSHKRWKLKKV